MGVTKIIHVAGTGPQPQVGQTVVIEYTGWLKDLSQPDGKGTQYVFFVISFPFPFSLLSITLIR